MRQLLSFLLLSAAITSCVVCSEPPSDNACLKADLIVEGCCSGSTVFNIDNRFALGDTITINGVTYENAIQIPGKHPSALRVKLRAFDSENDRDLLATNCNCIQAEPWAALPIYVITEDCSEPSE